MEIQRQVRRTVTYSDQNSLVLDVNVGDGKLV